MPIPYRIFIYKKLEERLKKQNESQQGKSITDPTAVLKPGVQPKSATYNTTVSKK